MTNNAVGFSIHSLYRSVLNSDIVSLREDLSHVGIDKKALCMAIEQAIESNSLIMLQMLHAYDGVIFKDFHYVEYAVLKSADLDVLGYLIEHISSINNHMEDFIIISCLLDRVDALIYLDNKGFNVSKGDVLRCATTSGAMKILKWLIPLIDLNEYGFGALQSACYQGNLEMVKELHQQGVDILKDGGVSLIVASPGSIELHQYLIDNGVRVDVLGREHIGSNYELLLDYQTMIIEHDLLKNKGGYLSKSEVIKL